MRWREYAFTVKERVQKILSQHGIAARRKAEDLIRAGRVSVNGKVAAIGEKADPTVDRVEVDGKLLESQVEKIYYLMYKPVGVETTMIVGRDNCHPEVRAAASHEGSHVAMVRGSALSLAPHHDTTVYDLLPQHLRGKVFPVGRLDKDSEGLLLFTNDGELKYRLEHPKFDHEKEYEVETVEEIHDGALRKLEKGVMLDGAKTKPARIARLGPRSFRIALTEGRNRQIRRMCQKVGSAVIRLRRVRIMSVQDEKLQPGRGRMLTEREIVELLEGTALAHIPSPGGRGLG